jgi:opacity protein-like surface antigen
MRMLNRVALTAAALAVMVTAPASAQSYRWDVGLKGGWSWYTDMLSRDNVTHDGTVRFGNGPLVGLQATYWAGNRLGIRLNADYADRSVDGEETAGGVRELWNTMNLWTATGDLMFRFSQPNETWMGAEVLPYLALGLGAKQHHAPASAYTLREAGETDGSSAAVFTARNENGDPVGPLLGIPSSWRLTGLVGLGADFRVAPNFALRLEGFDRIFMPRMHLVTPGTNPNWTQASTENESRLTHELGLALSLHLVAGLAAPPPVAVAPPPPPPPPAPPPPPPAPREDAITVCVIDPAAPGGMRNVQAIFRHEQRDTVVTVDGQRVPLRQQVTDVPTAAQATWYVRGEPMTLQVGTRRMEFMTYMTPRQIEPNMLTYLGRVDGLPVYADRDQAQRFIGQLEAARANVPDHNLQTILAQNVALRDAFADLAYLYLPMQTVGCIFQAVQPVEEVRKGK